jgi:hypothetical protein
MKQSINWLIAICCVILSLSCTKTQSNPDTTNNPTKNLPTVVTTSVKSISKNSAVSGGTVTSDYSEIIAKGVCWSTKYNPTILDNKTLDGVGLPYYWFESSISGLTQGTLYYLRAYATSKSGTSYGENIQFMTLSPALYAGGYESNVNKVQVAKIWKGTTITELTDGKYNGAVNSIFISGADIYACGYYGGVPNSMIWKNNSLIATTNSSSSNYASSIFVSNGNYYSIFNVIGTGILNGSVLYPTLVSSTSGGGRLIKINNNSSASSVFLSGTDIYVAGYRREFIPNACCGNLYSVAMLWKNGVSIDLNSTNNNAEARSVFISGNNVYVGGYESNGINSIAKIWKNGVGTNLSDGLTSTVINSLYINNSDVYAVGVEYLNGYSNGIQLSRAKLWKNGTPLNLTNGKFPAEAYSIFVAGSDVYCGGFESNGSKKVATIWKNGIPIYLSDGKNDAEVKSLYFD